MMSTAKVIPFRIQQSEQPEIKSGGIVADCDNGYTRLANDLYDALIGANLTKNQAKVAHAICRKTYGFNKKTDRISDSQISELTNLPRQKVNTAKNELITMNVIIKIGREIGPNKAISEWKTWCHQNSDNVTKTVTKTVTETVTAVSPKQGHTKDTITKDKKDNIANGASACADEPIAGQQEKSQPQKQKSQSKYQSVVDAYHRILPDMPSVRELTDQRKTKIKNFFSKYQLNHSEWEGYLEYIGQNCRWMFESRPRNRGANDESRWKPKNFDFLLTERCYLGVLEGTYSDYR